MPTYEYECKSCGHIKDVFHSMTVKRRVKCPECASPTKRLIGAGAGIIFKGTGFYETDYKRKSGSGDGQTGNGAKGEKSSESKGESKSESKSESKKAAKAEKS